MKDLKETERATMPPVLFSVIIPVRNEEHNLAVCLASLQRLQFAPESFEVIVVDNGSTDGTLKVAAKFQESLPLKILEKPDVYISALRNAGAKLARGNCFAFLDSDCEVLPDWLTQAAQAISSDGAKVFGSFYLIPDNSSWIARYWYDDREKKGRGEVSYLPAGDLFVVREVFQKVRGFDERIQTSEDVEFCRRVREDGFSIISVPEVGVVHWGTPQGLGVFFRKHRWHGMHVFRVFLRNPSSLKNFKVIALAFYTLICALCVLAGVGVGAGFGDFRLLYISLLALLTPPLLLGIQAAIAARRLGRAIPMGVLFLTYAIARAICLIDWRNWTRQRGPVAITDQQANV